MKHFIPALIFLSLALQALAEPLGPRETARIIEIGKRAGVPTSITYALMREESGGDPRVMSSRTKEGYRSRGLFQLYEKHEAELVQKHFPYVKATFNIWDPYDNAEVGLRYLAALHRQFGNWIQALEFYNCGLTVGVPESTRAYTTRITNASDP
jgi:soluble lytic murein transglycosylase-like protein